MLKFVMYLEAQKDSLLFENHHSIQTTGNLNTLFVCKAFLFMPKLHFTSCIFRSKVKKYHWPFVILCRIYCVRFLENMLHTRKQKALSYRIFAVFVDEKTKNTSWLNNKFKCYFKQFNVISSYYQFCKFTSNLCSNFNNILPPESPSPKFQRRHHRLRACPSPFSPPKKENILK